MPITAGMPNPAIAKTATALTPMMTFFLRPHLRPDFLFPNCGFFFAFHRSFGDFSPLAGFSTLSPATAGVTVGSSRGVNTGSSLTNYSLFQKRI